LSRIILTGLNASTFGILIARGDLAVEIGYENLSLIQEDVYVYVRQLIYLLF